MRNPRVVRGRHCFISGFVDGRDRSEGYHDDLGGDLLSAGN